MPCFKFFGTARYIEPHSPYDVQCSEVPDEVQLVCKYLRAFQTFEDGNREIDRLYPIGKYEYKCYTCFTSLSASTTDAGDVPAPPIKFSNDDDIPDEECHQLLSSVMNQKIKKNKLLQKLFVRLPPLYELHDLIAPDVLHLLRVIQQYSGISIRGATFWITFQDTTSIKVLEMSDINQTQLN